MSLDKTQIWVMKEVCEFLQRKTDGDGADASEASKLLDQLESANLLSINRHQKEKMVMLMEIYNQSSNQMSMGKVRLNGDSGGPEVLLNQSVWWAVKGGLDINGVFVVETWRYPL